MFVNTDPAIFSTLERKTKLCLVNTRVFPALYMQYILDMEKYIYIILQVIVDLCVTL